MGEILDSLLRNKWTQLALGVLVLTLTWWSVVDSSPPFYVKEYTQPAAVHAGGTVVFMLPVYRDVARNCSVKWTRHLIDSNSIRYDIDKDRFMSAESLRTMNKMMGQMLKISVDVPQEVSVGRTVLVTNLHYACNPWQKLFPIEVTLYFPFEVN